MNFSAIPLIGFLAFILCPTFCPMNIEQMPKGHVMHHEMDMGHTNESTCDHCEINSSIDLALTNSFLYLNAISTVVPSFILNTQNFEEPILTITPKSYLATAGPPDVPNIVSTIVLRT